MRCAFYEKELTPPLGGDSPGYYINRFTEDVADELYVRAVVFAPDTEDPAGTLAILTLDAVNVQRELANAIKARANAFTGIPVENIAVIANHSHYGCPHGDYGSDRDEEFMKLFPRLAADAITLAYKRLQKCKLTYGMGHEDRCAFVRDYVLDSGAIITNPGEKFKDHLVRHYSEPDPDLPVLTVWNENGERMGVIFTYALHQDTTGGKRYSGDYSSEVAKQLKDRYGHKFASIYVPGYCGDINHHDRFGDMSKWNHRSIGKLLSEESIRVTEEASAPVTDETLKVNAQSIIVQRRRVTPEQSAHCRWVLEDPQNRTSPYMMLGSKGYVVQLQYEEETAKLPNNDVDMPLQVMRIGDVWFYINPYEVYHQYAQPLKEATPSGKWLMSEMANTEGSYIPIPELMDTDIYPAWLCYGSWLEAEAGNKMVAKLVEMAQELK